MKTFDINGKPFMITKGRKLCMEPVFLDIETANNHAVDSHELITWITSIQVLWGDDYFFFRTPEELCEWYNKVIYDYRLFLSDELCPKLVTYCHNLNYEMSYLLPYFKKYLPHPDEDFMSILQGLNDYLTYDQGCLEWRCSLKLSNRSLYSWGVALNIPKELQKRLGTYDYDAIYYQDDELDEQALAYDKYDVVSLQACWRKQCQIHGDNLATIPLTSTGYVRRTLRDNCLANPDFKRINFFECKLDGELYTAFNAAYAGGYTHNNRFFKNIIMECGKSYLFNGRKIPVNKICHRDFKSFYPSILRTKTFPLGKWKMFYNNDFGPITIDDILKWSPEYTTMTRVRIYDCEIRDKNNSMPILQKSKLIFDKNDVVNIIEDNGRIIRMKANDNSNGFEIYLDNVMLNQFKLQYTGKIEILKSWRSKNKPLPKEICQVIDEFFKGKSDKKNIEKRFKELYGETDDHTMDAHTELTIVKALLNAIYGVFCMANVRDEFAIDEDNEFVKVLPYNRNDSMKTIQEKKRQYTEEQLEQYYERRSSFLSYPIGCLVTSYAKELLLQYVIDCIGFDHIIYCDTDSAFYISTPEIEERIEALNAEHHKTAPYVVLENGNKEYYDVFEKEPHDLIAFKGLHSKCYGYVTDDNELVIVIAGVPARTLLTVIDNKPIYYTREQELAGVPTDFYKMDEYKDKKILIDPIEALDRLNETTIFRVNTGMQGTQIGAHGKGSEKQPDIFEIDGHTISTAGGLVLRPLEAKCVTEGSMLEYKRDSSGKLIQVKVKDLIL